MQYICTSTLISMSPNMSMLPSWFVAEVTSIITVDYVLTAKNLLKTGDRCITQLVTMSIDHRFVELTADVRIIL